jgi:hypothetical protein
VVRERYRRLRSGLVPLGLRIRRLARRAASARRAILQVSPPGVPPGVPPVGRVAVGGGVTCGLPVAASTVPVLLLEVAVVASTLLERTAVVTTDDVLDVDVVWIVVGTVVVLDVVVVVVDGVVLSVVLDDSVVEVDGVVLSVELSVVAVVDSVVVVDESVVDELDVVVVDEQELPPFE